MAERVFLHIGGPKCGTTYLQTVLWSSRDRLAEAGVLLPGTTMFHHNVAATWARTPRPRPRGARVWQRMLAQVEAHPGTAVYSNEWFTMADAAGASKVLEAFGDAEVHVVFTARDLLGVVPAAWQEKLKLGHGGSLGEFVDGLADPGQRWCWWTLDPAEVLQRWALPPERIHVVTLPAERGRPTELWERFASVIGIPDGVADLDAARPNESVGVVSARLLQDLGPRLREAIDHDDATWQEPYRWLRRYVSHELLVPRGGAPIRLDDDRWRQVRERTMASVEWLRSAGHDVVGSLDDLTALEPDPRAVSPESVTDAELLEASYDLCAALLGQLRRTADTDAHVPGTL
ncbi:hypothetical protein [Nocardioides sp.]|uniref:hypothetical protein n=1 Tax=Nocardioides sp. TaxID=35761 RepID=UPI002ED5CFBA